MREATISEAYTAEQKRLHQNPDYGQASVVYAPAVKQIMTTLKLQSLSDYGAGKQRLRTELDKLGMRGYRYFPYDPAFPDYGPPQPADLLCCIDVLEHIEPDYLPAVLRELRSLTMRYGFLSVTTRPAKKTLSDGRNAHLIQRPTSWWLPRFCEHYDIVQLDSTTESFAVIVTPRRPAESDTAARGLWPATQFNAPPRVAYEDPDYHQRYEKALAATKTRDNPMRRMRYFGIEQAVRAVADVEGDACEIGCLAGHSAWLAADAFRRLSKPLTFHLCDSFEGLSDYTDNDRGAGGALPDINRETLKCPEHLVQQNLAEFGFIRTHKGWIPEPFKALQDTRFCYAHIDVDLYEPTRDSIRFVWERLNPKGVVLFDDYGSRVFPGARRAIDEFFKGRKDFFLHEQPAGQAIAVKIA